MYRKTYRTYHNLFDRKFFKKIYIGCPSLFPFTNFQGCFYFILTRIPSPSPLFSSHYVYNTSPVEHVHIVHFQMRTSIYSFIPCNACAHSHCSPQLLPYGHAWLRRPFPLCILIFVFISVCLQHWMF